MKKKKIRMISIVTMSTFIVAGVGLGTGLGLVENNISISPHMTNSIFISNFIYNINNNNENFIKKSDFNKAFELIEGEVASSTTVEEAFKNDLFKFTIPDKVDFYCKKYGVEVFVKKYVENSNQNSNEIYPTNYNSSSPEFRIWFSKGEGLSYVEDYITISNSGLYGFIKTQEELDVNVVVDLFNEPGSIKLKPEFYEENIDPKIKNGTYAKNIIKTDIVLNETITNKLRGVNWNITSISQDTKIPSTLIINIDFSQGSLYNNYFSKTYQRFEMTNFPIEQGVDDYISKVDNFIKDPKNTIGLGAAFTYKKKEKNDVSETVRQAYENDSFSFEVPSSYKSQANSVGVEYVFKKYDKTNDSAFPDEENSEIPKFKIFVKSGVGTPSEYEDFFIVKGTSQVTDIPFAITDQEKLIEKLEETSAEIKYETITLGGEFEGIDSKELTANIVAKKDPKNVKLTLVENVGDEFIHNPITSQISDKNGELSVKVPIAIGTPYIDQSLFYKTFTTINEFKDETEFNTAFIDLYSPSITPDNFGTKFIINPKKTLNENTKIDDFLFSITKGNGEYYFNKEVIVNTEGTLPDYYNWSKPPIFKINFVNTKINPEETMIIFEIEMISGNTTLPKTVEIPISKFIKPITP